MVEWGIVKGVVSSSADRVVSVEVSLERLMGISGEEVGVLRFFVFGVSRTCSGLA